MSIDYSFNVCLVGNSGIGKTSFAQRLKNNEFYLYHNVTIGVEFVTFLKKIEYKNSNYILKWNIYDTAGQEKYASLINSYYRLGSIILLGFDITKKKSFEELKKWLNTINNYSNNFIKIYLFGNKLDLNYKREILPNNIKDFIKENKLEYFEISVKDYTNINKLINKINIDILDYILDKKISKEEKIQNKIKFIKDKEKKYNYIKKKENNKCCIIL